MWGIGVNESSKYNKINSNIVSNTQMIGIFAIFSSNNNEITGNTVSNNDGYGIAIGGKSNNNIIERNLVTNNRYGIGINDDFKNYTNNNIIRENNLIENEYHAVFNQSFFNLWYGNYWDDWSESKPRPINGDNILFDEIVPWVQFDWKPAQEPYDIDV